MAARQPIELPEHLKEQVIREFIPDNQYLSISIYNLNNPRLFKYNGLVHQFEAIRGPISFMHKPISLPSSYGITNGMFNPDVRLGATNTGGTEGENTANSAGTGSTGGRRHTSRRSKRKSHKSRRHY